ncbi:MAG: hypothetical protein AB4426_29940 [Xenococcaceae cyanobacterium]
MSLAAIAILTLSLLLIIEQSKSGLKKGDLAIAPMKRTISLPAAIAILFGAYVRSRPC